MNKRELVEAVAAATGLGRSAAGAAVEAVLEAVAAGLAAGEAVTVPGFGTFEVRERAARTGRNPRTGEAIEIAAARVPAFRAGKGLRERVN
ncbi:MAG: HU family DNA-binding protein [Gammaproteobacteria bacterium]|nr:HU family DNA-binding protein [Gammaproteobacteria bacterium]